MNYLNDRPRGQANQRGMTTLLVVLVMLTMMLLAAVSMARFSEVRTLLTGNLSFKDRSLQSSEVGLNTAYALIQAPGFLEDTPVAGWYYATQQNLDAAGMPANVDWTVAPVAPSTGAFEVRYVVERLCTVTPVTDPANQCLVRRDDALQSSKAGSEEFDALTGRQFRITVMTSGSNDNGKLGRNFVQTLVTRG